MALTAQTQAKYWVIAAAVLFGLLWFLGDVILPFVLGGAIAYCLDPLADRLEAMGLSRIVSTVIISLFGLLVFIIAVVAIVPTMVSQAAALIDIAPKLFANLQDFLTKKFPSLVDDSSVVGQTLLKFGAQVQAYGGALLSKLLSSALGVINIVMLLVIVPVVAFYMLLDWDRMVANVDSMLPRDHAPAIRALAFEINKTLASFIRGVGTVSLILGTYYAISLALVGLNYGLIIGAIAGFLTFIPYVGALIGGALAIGLALFQFWGGAEVVDGETIMQATNWFRIALVAAIFVIGQAVEGNFLTPKLVGESVGLHPVWLMFALSVFGSLFGFVGMLVAVPIAAALGVVVRFFLGYYKEGRLYQGVAGMPEDQDDQHG